MSNREEAVLAKALIPGAYERRPMIARQSGTMGGPAFGVLDPPSGPSTMDETTRAARWKEGGGGVRQRRPQRNNTGGRS